MNDMRTSEDNLTIRHALEKALPKKANHKLDEWAAACSVEDIEDVGDLEALLNRDIDKLPFSFVLRANVRKVRNNQTPHKRPSSCEQSSDVHTSVPLIDLSNGPDAKRPRVAMT